MKAKLSDIKNQSMNRLLIISLHIIGWISFISVPFMFFGPNRFSGRPPMPREGMRPPPGMQMPQPSEFDMHTMRLHSILFNVLLIGFFYLNMYVLIPKVLSRKSWVHYLISIVVCFIAIGLASELINHILASYSFRPRPFYF